MKDYCTTTHTHTHTHIYIYIYIYIYIEREREREREKETDVSHTDYVRDFILVHNQFNDMSFCLLYKIN